MEVIYIRISPLGRWLHQFPLELFNVGGRAG